MANQDLALTFFRNRAEHLVSEAAKHGVVLTVSQAPLKPLAMGNYETVVDVRPAREMAASARPA